MLRIEDDGEYGSIMELHQAGTGLSVGVIPIRKQQERKFIGLTAGANPRIKHNKHHNIQNYVTFTETLHRLLLQRRRQRGQKETDQGSLHDA